MPRTHGTENSHQWHAGAEPREERPARKRTGSVPVARRRASQAGGPVEAQGETSRAPHVPEPLVRRWAGVYRRPRLVAHVGWGPETRERRVAAALLEFDGTYLVHPARAAPDPEFLLEELRRRVDPSDAVLVGLDLPLGLPERYATAQGVQSFTELLPQLGRGAWKDFFEVARTREEVAPSRPFFAGADGSADAQLARALDVHSPEDLRRRCERTPEGRALPGNRFATVGSAGTSVVAGWRDLLLPARRALGPALALWPFQGTLDELLGAGRIVVAETHPAALFRLLLGEGASLRDAEARRRAGVLLCERAGIAGLRLTPAAQAQLEAGGGERPEAEADFAAVAGLLGMLAVVLGFRHAGEPADDVVRRVEGWAFGQT